MEDNGLPAVGQLQATPEILRGLMRELTEEDARWKPAPDRFSVAEVLAHLSQSEGDYRLRLDRFMNEERPELEPDEAQFHLDLYRNADPEDSFDHFEEQRESNIEFLRNSGITVLASALQFGLKFLKASNRVRRESLEFELMQ
jgi:hypothetical protein